MILSILWKTGLKKLLTFDKKRRGGARAPKGRGGNYQLTTAYMAEKTQSQKRRSRLYPRYDLQEAIHFIKLLETMGGEGVSEQAVASSLGKGVNNSTFHGRLSAAKQFGLLVEEKGRLSLTEVGRRIVRPSEPAQSGEALRVAFTRPSLYGELIRAFQGRVLPEPSYLCNRLVNEYGIEAGAKERAAKNFLNSAKYANLVQNGILVTEAVAQDGKADTETDEGWGDSRSEEHAGVPGRGSFVFEFAGGIKLLLTKDERSSAAIMEGKLKEVKEALDRLSETLQEGVSSTQEDQAPTAIGATKSEARLPLNR